MGDSLAGYWWLGAKTYLRDRPPIQWVNKDSCIAPGAEGRFEDEIGKRYLGTDRSFAGLIAKPRFALDGRERRPLALRGLAKASTWRVLDPCFVIAPDFAALLSGLDPDCLTVAPADLVYHQRVVEDACLLADTTHCLDGLEVFDRTSSVIELQCGFAADDGRRVHAIHVNGPVSFKPPCGQHDCFRILLGWAGSRVAVSDRVAEALFAQRLPGVALRDVGRERKAPAYYEENNPVGWEDVYPG